MSIKKAVFTQLQTWIASAHAEQPLLAISHSDEQLQELCVEAIRIAVPGTAAKQGNHPDAITIIGEKNKITVKQIKELRAILATKPQSGKRIVCIPHAEELLPASANMLLKTLEESQHQTRFLLGSPAKKSILPTIQSRCQLLFLGSTPISSTTDISLPELLKQYSQVRVSEAYSEEDLGHIAQLVHTYTKTHGSTTALARVAMRLRDYYRTEKVPGGNTKLAADALLASLAELRNTRI